MSENQPVSDLIHKYAFILDLIPAEILITTRKAEIIYVNRKVSELSGYSREELIGQNPRLFKSGKMPAEVYRDLWTTISAGREWHGEFQNRRKNGSLYWMINNITPLTDNAGILTHYIAIRQDITEIKHLQQQLHDAMLAAQEANQAKSTFLSHMSHELRTPLNSVIGFTAVMQKNKPGNLSPADLTYLARINDNGKHLLSLINQFLDIAKIEAGKMTVDLTRVNLTQLINEVGSLIGGTLAGKNLKLHALVPDNLMLTSDPVMLKQIIINLVGNAVKFTADGSVSVTATVSAGQVDYIEVADTGIGIPADKLDMIFDSFFQADASTRKLYGGTGLGLTITKKMCELLGYWITVSSTPGKGTAFRIIFPRQGIKP